MHIPDGFLDLRTSVTTYLSSGFSLGIILKKLESNFKEEDIPMLGLLGAFIFAAQMINLPIAGATSGHLMGGVLAMLVVGPWAAAIIMASVLVIQAVLFMDGGIAVLGANVFNMAIVQVFTGYGIYFGLKKVITSIKIRTFLAAFLATVIAAFFVALELSLSGTISFSLVLPAMLGWHLLVGLIEAVITLFIIGYLQKVAPERLNFLKQERYDNNV